MLKLLEENHVIFNKQDFPNEMKKVSLSLINLLSKYKKLTLNTLDLIYALSYDNTPFASSP